MNAWNQKCLPTSQSMDIDELDNIVGHLQLEVADLRRCENQIHQLRRDMSDGMAQFRRNMRMELDHAKEAMLEYVSQVETDNKELRHTIEEQGEMICELQRLVDDQRQMMEVMWNAPGMPGGQETIQRIKESVAKFFDGGTHSHITPFVTLPSIDRENGDSE